MKKAKIQKKEVILDKFGKTLVKERLKVSDGSELDWYYLDTPASILVVPLTVKRELVLVKVYRYNLKKTVYEIPAGNFENPKGDLSSEAKRELLEETGYRSQKFIDLGRHYVLPSETNRWIHIVLGLNAKKEGEPKLDNMIEKYFDISVELFDFKRVADNIGKSNSIIQGAEHGYAILLADRHLKISA
jgi:8-oxo-dGTP pyrophosphatase MutT (NUDIX family)